MSQRPGHPEAAPYMSQGDASRKAARAVLGAGLCLVMAVSGGAISAPARAATAGQPAASPAALARPPARAVPGRRLVIRVKGLRLGRRARVTVIGYSGRADGVRRTVRIRRSKTLRRLPPGRYKVRAHNIYHRGQMARWRRITNRRLSISRSRGARTTITYARDSWKRRARAAISVASSRPGRVSFAVADDNGRIVAGHDARNRVNSASVIKSMFLAAYLRSPSVANRGLTRSEKARLRAMITRSSNSAATRTRDLLGFAAINQLALDAGMIDFRQRSAWGTSQITAADMARLFARLEELIPRRHQAYALRLLSSVVPQHRWGIPPETPRNWTWHIKGGWLGKVVNQAALLKRGKRRLSLVVLIERTPGIVAFVGNTPRSDVGPTTIRKVAHQLLRNGIAHL